MDQTITKKLESWLIVFLFIAAAAVFGNGKKREPSNAVESFAIPSFPHEAALVDDNCATCHQKHDAGTVGLYSSSAHAAAGITCDRCHGGEQLTTDKRTAHAGRFIGQPASDQVLGMCGSCHRPQLAMFKTSRHFPARKGVPRVDCAQCHGAHTVGSPSRSFSFAYYCSGCHGQEYLPELPRFFPQVLELADYLAETKHAMGEGIRKPAEDEAALRREIRTRIAEIVHSTDLAGSVEKAPEILKLGETLKKKR
ncbi:MAG TPA: cytochrome c3 family protein [Blastocatellia bacterium]|nr:cytochrome c3 family protein [Blastocatellia bacterium]